MDMQKVKRLSISMIAGVTFVALVALYGIAGVTNIEPGEVGLKVVKIGMERGIDKLTLNTGIHWVEPFTNDVAIYDTRAKQYDLPDVPSTTMDGQPIRVDLSVELSLVDVNVPSLHETIGANYYEQVVKPAVRSTLRNTTTGKLSDEIYTGEGRAFVQDTMQKVLQTKLEPKGIHILVNLRALDFSNQDFVKKLEEKAKAAQQITVNERLAKAAEWEAQKVANIAEGEKQKRIKSAEAEREELRLNGEGERLKKEETAKGILAIAKAEAEGARLQVSAYGDGKTYASVKWAENLGPNVKVWGVPTGAPGTASFIDLNGMVKGAFSGVSAK